MLHVFVENAHTASEELVYVCICVCVCMYVCIRMHIPPLRSLCMYVYVCVYVCMYVCIRMHIPPLRSFPACVFPGDPLHPLHSSSTPTTFLFDALKHIHSRGSNIHACIHAHTVANTSVLEAFIHITYCTSKALRVPHPEASWCVNLFRIFPQPGVRSLPHLCGVPLRKQQICQQGAHTHPMSPPSACGTPNSQLYLYVVC